MSQQVIIRVDKQQAVSAAFIMGELSRADIDVKRALVMGEDDRRCQLVMWIDDSTAISESDLLPVLEAIPGFLECLPTQGLDAVQLQLIEAARGDSTLVDEIAWAYPRMAPRVDKMAAKLSTDAREHELTKLGVAVGQRLAFPHLELHSCEALPEILKQGVMPILHGAAEGTALDDRINIVRNSFVRRNLDMLYLPMDDFPSNCVFLKGLILGVVNGGTPLKGLSVEETSCRGSGDALCTFIVGQG